MWNRCHQPNTNRCKKSREANCITVFFQERSSFWTALGSDLSLQESFCRRRQRRCLRLSCSPPWLLNEFQLNKRYYWSCSALHRHRHPCLEGHDTSPGRTLRVMCAPITKIFGSTRPTSRDSRLIELGESVCPAALAALRGSY
jgi:hypothetical protein